MNLIDKPITAIDVETTGVGRDARIIEIAAVKAKIKVCGDVSFGNMNSIKVHELPDIEILGSYSSLVNPGMEIDQVITDITGISNYDLKGAPTFEEIRYPISSLCEDSQLLAYNWPFDRRIITAEEIRLSRYDICRDGINTLALDPYAMVNHITKYLKGGRQLSRIAELCGRPPENAHRAEDDCISAIHVFACYYNAVPKFNNSKTFIQMANNCIAWTNERVESYRDYLRRTKTPEKFQCQFCGVEMPFDDYDDHECEMNMTEERA